MKLDQQKFNQWNDWANKIGNDFTSILSRRKIFKTFMDVFVDSIATGIGGLMLILLTSVLGLPVSAMPGEGSWPGRGTRY